MRGDRREDKGTGGGEVKGEEGRGKRGDMGDRRKEKGKLVER